MKYALAVPFIERFFDLALDGRTGPVAGYVGLIVANSFMKREFGKKLIEEDLPRLDLTHVIDTSGAYIPGHGTPTVILFGRNARRSRARCGPSWASGASQRRQKTPPEVSSGRRSCSRSIASARERVRQRRRHATRDVRASIRGASGAAVRLNLKAMLEEQLQTILVDELTRDIGLHRLLTTMKTMSS